MADVRLRDVEEGDLPTFFEHQRDPVANAMAAFPPRDWEVFLGHWTVKVASDPNAKKQTILDRGKVAGNIVSWTANGRRLVGYWIGREHWGSGVATAALTQFLEQETTRPLHAYVIAHNVGSMRVLEKCGFRRIEAGEEHTFELSS